jgi:hypothetical protein
MQARLWCARKESMKEPRRTGPPVGGVSFNVPPVAAQRPTTGRDRPTSAKLARALRSSCDDHHKRALFSSSECVSYFLPVAGPIGLDPHSDLVARIARRIPARPTRLP